MKKLTPRMLGVVALVALTTSLTAVSAQAADTAPDDAAAAVALNAQVQSGAIAASALTPSQIDLLSRFGTVARTDTKTTITPISTSDPRVADAVAGVKAKVGVAAAAAIQCKQARGERVAKSAAGNNLYMSYHVGAWCYSYTPPVGLITVTSATWVDGGGQTYWFGWENLGRINQGAAVVSNQGRSYSQQSFKNSLIAQSVQPCVRVKGTTSAAIDYTCGVY